MKVDVKLERQTTQVRWVSVDIDADEILDQSLYDAVESSIGSGNYELADEDVHDGPEWEIDRSSIAIS